MKKAIALVLSFVLAMGLVACGGGTSSSAPAGSTPSESTPADSTTSTPEENTNLVEGEFTIGVSQFVQHGALDAAYEGFIDALAEEGFVEGKNLTINYNNASGDMANANTIATTLVNAGVDLILAIATPSAIAAANATTEIPILITAVTGPEDEGLVATNEAPGGNVSGTSDLTACAEQMQLLTEILPDAEIVGIIYNSSESNSELQYALAKEAAEALGLTVERYTVSDAGEVQQVVNSMVGKVDVIYAPTDNIIAEAMATVATIATENGIPTIVGEEGMVNEGGLASWSMSYYQIGLQTGAQAAKILRGEAEPATMPIEYDENISFVYNKETYDALRDQGVNVLIPDEYIAQAKNETAK